MGRRESGDLAGLRPLIQIQKIAVAKIGAANVPIALAVITKSRKCTPHRRDPTDADHPMASESPPKVEMEAAALKAVREAVEAVETVVLPPATTALVLENVLSAVVLGALLIVGEDLVGLADFGEPRLHHLHLVLVLSLIHI